MWKTSQINLIFLACNIDYRQFYWATIYLAHTILMCAALLTFSTESHCFRWVKIFSWLSSLNWIFRKLSSVPKLLTKHSNMRNDDISNVSEGEVLIESIYMNVDFTCSRIFTHGSSLIITPCSRATLFRADLENNRYREK